MNSKIKGNLILLITAIIWGTSFVAQSIGVDELKPTLFNGVRSIIGAVVLIPFVLLFSRKRLKDIKLLKSTVKGGIICGVILCFASALQTSGLETTTAAKAGFITALYMVMVPVFSVFLGKRLNFQTVSGVVIAVIGMYLLCMTNENIKFGIGEFQVLICSVLFTLHILAIDKFSGNADGITMSCIQFAVAGLLNLVYNFARYGFPDSPALAANWMPLMYSGALSCGIAYTLQIIGQKYADPTPASIIMSLESVFAAIGGWVILNESMTIVEILGCIIMFAAIIIVQIPQKAKLRS